MTTRTSSLQNPSVAPLSAAPATAGLRMPSNSNSAASQSQYGHAHSKSHSGNTNIAAGLAGMPGSSMDRSVSSVGGLSPTNANAAAAALANNAAKIRASLDAARTLYGPTGAQGNPGIGLGHPVSPNIGVGGFNSRNTSATSNNGRRPASELLPGGTFNSSSAGAPTDADVIDRWFEDLHHYEATLEEMAAASLDQAFKEELGAIEQWFRVLSEAERTAALYSLIQSSSQVQIRFFITVLQQMARTDPMSALLSPANPQQASMEAQMDAKLASIGLKTPVSPAMRQLARQSLNAIPTNTADISGFLSPHSAMLSQSASPRADSLPLDDTLSASDAASRLAQQRAKLSNSYASNRISAPGALLSANDVSSIKSSLWSQANNDSVAERSGRSPSPDSRLSNSGNNARSRPTSMLSDSGLPVAGNSANNLNIPGQDASINVTQRPSGINTNLSLSIGADGQLSPMMTGQNWATMMQTPLMTSFSAAALASAGGDNGSAFSGFDSQASRRDNAWGIQSASASAVPNPIALDDARKFRRNARVSDAGVDGANGVQGIMSNMYSGVGGQHNNDYGRRAVSAAAATGAQAQHANQAALSAQQNWRNVNGLSNIQGSPSLGLGSPDLSNNIATLQAAMQNMNSINNLNNLASPQLAMANLLAAQQQIQQQMQLQQNLLNMTGMSPLGLMGVQNQMQNQQMLSPVLGGMGTFGQGGMNGNVSNTFGNRRSPRPSDRGVSGSQNKSNLIVPGCGTNPDEPIDMSLLADIPSWLRSLRLHKYTTNFERCNWRDMIMMDDGALEGMGVSALGARRKLLKVFENVRNQQGIPHPPGFDSRAESPMPGKSDTEE